MIPWLHWLRSIISAITAGHQTAVAQIAQEEIDWRNWVILVEPSNNDLLRLILNEDIKQIFRQRCLDLLLAADRSALPFFWKGYSLSLITCNELQRLAHHPGVIQQIATRLIGALITTSWAKSLSRDAASEIFNKYANLLDACATMLPNQRAKIRLLSPMVNPFAATGTYSDSSHYDEYFYPAMLLGLTAIDDGERLALDRQLRLIIFELVPTPASRTLDQPAPLVVRWYTSHVLHQLQRCPADLLAEQVMFGLDHFPKGVIFSEWWLQQIWNKLQGDCYAPVRAMLYRAILDQLHNIKEEYDFPRYNAEFARQLADECREIGEILDRHHQLDEDRCRQQQARHAEYQARIDCVEAALKNP